MSNKGAKAMCTHTYTQTLWVFGRRGQQECAGSNGVKGGVEGLSMSGEEVGDK